MAPRALYERPNVQLLRLLQDAKVAGMSFGEAWVLALRPGKAIVMTTTEVAPAGSIRWPTDRTDRDAWRDAIVASRDAWRRAFYDHEPTGPEVALVELSDAFELLDHVSGERAAREGIADDRRLVSAA